MTTGVPFDSWYKDQFVEKVRDGYPPRLARLELETPFTWKTIKTHLEADHEFRDRVEDALADSVAAVEHAVYKEAKAGNLGAARLFLANRGDWVDERNHGPKAPAGASASLVSVSVDTLRELLVGGDTRAQVIEAASTLKPAELVARDPDE